MKKIFLLVLCLCLSACSSREACYAKSQAEQLAIYKKECADRGYTFENCKKTKEIQAELDSKIAQCQR